jgi:polyadenylation factor subunit 2
LPPGFPPPPPGLPGLGGTAQLPFPAPNQDGGGGAGGVRKRGPLPSQEESLQMEQRRGNFTKAR